MEKIVYSPGEVPVLADVDLCVAGGSCTGVFAAVTAARSGARVALVEAQNRFGGTAVASLGQLLAQSLDARRLTADRVRSDPGGDRPLPGATRWSWRPTTIRLWYARLNTEELAIELDELVRESGVMPFLHTRAVDVLRDDRGALAGIVTAGKDGLGVLRAEVLHRCDRRRRSLRGRRSEDVAQCDASAGDRLCEVELLAAVQTAAGRTGSRSGAGVRPAGGRHLGNVPAAQQLLYAGGHQNRPDRPLDAAALTAGEIEGRRQLRAIQDIIARAGYTRPVLEALPSLIGIRRRATSILFTG